MKKVMILALMAFNANASLPDLEESLRVTFEPATCGTAAPELMRTFTPPAPGYDTAEVSWTMALRQTLEIESFSVFSNVTGVLQTGPFAMQARFPLGGGGSWYSIGTSSQVYTMTLVVPPGEFRSDSKVRRYKQTDEVGGIDQMDLSSGTMFFKCLGANNQFQANGSYSASIDVDGIGALLKITWKDLF